MCDYSHLQDTVSVPQEENFFFLKYQMYVHVLLIMHYLSEELLLNIQHENLGDCFTFISSSSGKFT